MCVKVLCAWSVTHTPVPHIIADSTFSTTVPFTAFLGDSSGFLPFFGVFTHSLPWTSYACSGSAPRRRSFSLFLHRNPSASIGGAPAPLHSHGWERPLLSLNLKKTQEALHNKMLNGVVFAERPEVINKSGRISLGCFFFLFLFQEWRQLHGAHRELCWFLVMMAGPWHCRSSSPPDSRTIRDPHSCLPLRTAGMLQLRPRCPAAPHPSSSLLCYICCLSNELDPGAVSSLRFPSSQAALRCL